MNKGLKTRISNLIRKDLKKCKHYNEAKNKHFKGMTVYQCPECKGHFYTGASAKNFEKLKEETYPDLVRIKSSGMNMDHVDPIIPYDSSLDEMSLEEIAERTYCFSNPENISYVCSFCHKEKTKRETSVRAKYKELKKLEEK